MIKYITTLLSTKRYLYIKATGLPILGQPKRDTSMSEKGYWKSISWATLFKVRITNLFKQKGGKKVPNYYQIDKSCNLSVFFYIVEKIQKCLRTQNSVRIFNFVRDLKTDSDVLLKKSGNPDHRKVWGFGKIVVPKPFGFGKGLSSIASQRPLLSGDKVVRDKLKELEIQVDDFIKTGKKIRELSNILAIPEFLEGCYYKIRASKRDLASGLDKITLDGIDKKWFETVSQRIVNGNITFNPLRRELLPNPQGGKHPSGVPLLIDKIVQEALRQLLEIIFEKIFDMNSHGVRANRSCHTILKQIRIQMSSTRWFIKGDISKCYDSMDHTILVSKLCNVINDQSFIDLIYKVLRSGYGKSVNKVHRSKIGLPQKGVINQVLANVYLHYFDLIMSKKIQEFNKGKSIKANADDVKMIRNSKVDRTQNLLLAMENDEKFKRMRYIRYADNFLIGVIGSKEDCVKIRSEVSKILYEQFKLTLNLDKTKVSHASSDGAYFMGHSIRIADVSKHQTTYLRRGNCKSRTKLTSRLLMDAPTCKVIKKLALASYCKKSGQPTSCGRLIHEPLHKIINNYLALQWRLLNYYNMSSNYGRFSARIHYILKYSCALTFALKLKLKTLKKVYRKFGKDLTVFDNESGKILATFPRIPYKKSRKKVNAKIFNPLESINESVNFINKK